MISTLCKQKNDCFAKKQNLTYRLSDHLALWSWEHFLVGSSLHWLDLGILCPFHAMEYITDQTNFLPPPSSSPHFESSNYSILLYTQTQCSLYLTLTLTNRFLLFHLQLSSLCYVFSVFELTRRMSSWKNKRDDHCNKSGYILIKYMITNGI